MLFIVDVYCCFAVVVCYLIAVAADSVAAAYVAVVAIAADMTVVTVVVGIRC